MKTILFTMCVFLCVSCQDTRSEKNQKKESVSQLKVGAYNVEYSKNATATEIGEALKPYNFDVVCFSEAPGGDWTKEIGAVMGLNHVVVGRYSTAGHVDKYKTIASQTPLYDYEEVLMADTLHTATKAKTKIGKTEISIYSVHFPFGWRDQAHIDETTNKISTLADYIKEKQQNEIAVVAGDFNFIPSNEQQKSQYHELFTSIGLDVTWRELGIDCTKRNTDSPGNPELEGKGQVIDHIMYNPDKMKVLEGEIIEMDKPLSDHKPVWALLELKN